MGEIIEMPRKHIVVTSEKAVHVIGIDDIRAIAQGRASIAEYEEPELMAKALAIMALEYLND